MELGFEGQRPLGALEALSVTDNFRMVLLGLPGTGKSTFVRYVALRMAQAEVDRGKNIQDLLPGWKGGSVLPIIVPLGRMAESIPSGRTKGSADLVEKFILQTLESDDRTTGFAASALSELKQSGGLVLFDGLDEVSDLTMRPIVVQSVEDFVQKYARQSASRFLVTCRTYSYHHDTKWQMSGWPTHELALLDEEKIQYFVNAWHDEHIRIELARKPDYERKRKQLLASLQPDDRRRLHEIAPFPIILTMMAVVHTHYGELPNTRAQVYERCVDLLLVRWELERPVSGQSQKTQKRTIIDELGVDRIELDRALWEIAFRAHEGRTVNDKNERGPALVTEDLLTGVLFAHFHDPQKVQIFLDYCQSANGLLMLQGSIAPADAAPGTPPRRVYAFPHLTFEEYLAARYLVRPNFGKMTRDLVQKSDRWREVVMLLGEHLCFAQGDQERMETLLNALTPEKLPASSEHPDWRAIWYTGDLLVISKPLFKNEKPAPDKKIRDGLYQLVMRSALSPRERTSAADTLDELGYAPPDLYAFLPIPEGKGLLSKYLVTNAQYERFLNAPDFTERKYWVDFPKFDEESRPMKKTWGEEGWKFLNKTLDANGKLEPRYWRDPRFGLSRRHAPVVGLSWYEASAYGQWLREHWETLEEGKQGLARPLEVRLPTETEWSAAAGGEADDRYAWGVLKNKKEITRFANTAESGINRTTPVWMYPQGHSPAGMLDLSGNVWEWQANYRSSKEGYLGLRGGSWGSDGDGARVAVRNYNLPFYWLDYIGFRVWARPQ